MKHKVKFLLIKIFILIIFSTVQFVCSSTLTISGCYPNIANQGRESVILMLVLNKPINDTNLELKTQFSNKGINVKKIEIVNPSTLKCEINIEQNAKIEKKNPSDIIIEGYKGKEKIVEMKGESLFTILRKPKVGKIKVKTKSGKVVRGQKAKINIYGYSFLKGEVGITLAMSGFPKKYVKCGKEKKLVLKLSKQETLKIMPGKYAVSLSNKDGSFFRSNELIEVIEP